VSAHRLKVRTPDDPLFASVARMVNPPRATAERTLFEPAYASFDIAAGTTVDVSYFYEPPSARPWEKGRTGFDRHLATDELWVVTEGDLLLPLAPCARPDDPEDEPRPEQFLCFAFRAGDLFVVKPNVWHCGPWAAADRAVRFFMMLSGHRKAAAGGNVDHIVKRFPEGVEILPDVDDRGRPR
jgi:hypothetical protein